MKPFTKIVSPARLLLGALALAGLHGCGGGGSSGISNPSDQNGSPTTTYTLSGTLTPVNGIVVDSDINDAFAGNTPNNTEGSAQPITNLSNVHGFVTATGTSGSVSGSPSVENFADSTDRLDYFVTALQAGQVISLDVVDSSFNADGYQGDIDLALIDSDGNLVDSSDNIGSSESVTAPTSGTYYIQVYAYEGTSKYTLQIAPADAQTRRLGQTTARQTEFVAGEILVSMENPSIATLNALSTKVLGQSANKRIASRNPSAAGPQRLTFDPLAGLPVGVMNQSDSSLGDHQAKLQTLRLIKTMAQEPGVKYAEPNYIRQINRTPNDLRYVRQWNLRNIEAPAAWEITTGSREDGNEVIVAVVDTGVYLAHNDLADQLTNDGYDFISDRTTANDGDGIDSNPDDPGDNTTPGLSSWHGTHVAGIVAAASNNLTGISGVSWDARIMPIRALGVGGGTDYDILQGMFYAAGLENDSGTLPNRRADIINLSLGGFGSSQAVQDGIDDIHDAGVIIVAASGNEGTSQTAYPAGYNHVIAVGATDAQDGITEYSNFGNHLDLSAPGGDTSVDTLSDGQPDGILSTVVDDTQGGRRSSYAYYQGTSMAAPHVAGVLALMKAVHPGLTPNDVDALIANGRLSDDLGAAGRDNYHGYGGINALKAVTEAMELAADGGEVVLPVLLSSDPSSIALGSADSATFTISNQGGGEPSIDSVSGGSDWLTVTADEVDANGLGRYRVNVERSGLVDGFYRDTITATDVAGSRVELTLSMYVGDIDNRGELTVQYILVTDQQGDIVAQASTDALGNYDVDVPAGDYEIYAGSDIDVDLFICTRAETCGAYPSLGNPETVSVTDRNLSNIDFDVSLALQAVDAASASLNRGGPDNEGRKRLAQ